MTTTRQRMKSRRMSPCVGDILRAAMSRSSISQSDLALDVRIHPSRLSQIKNGRGARMTEIEKDKIALALGWDAGVLFPEEADEDSLKSSLALIWDIEATHLPEALSA